MAAGSRLFSDKLDRVAFSAYFLGAVVPLIALAVVVERFALPTLADRNDALGLIGVVISAALLSLGSFLVLRNRTRHSLERMDADNRRLTSLLRVSSQLAAVQHVTEATHCAAEQSLMLADATAAYLFVRGTNDDEPALAAAAGEGAPKLYERLEAKLAPLPRMIFESQRPVLRGAEDGDDFTALAVPMPGEKAPIGVLLAVRTGPVRDFSAAEVDAVSTLAALAGVALNNGDLRDAQRNFFAHVTDILVNALDAHLEFNQGHGHRVAQLANRLGRRLELDEATMQRLHFASLLHDIGMLKLDRRQQMNPKTCDKHTIIGSRMLGRIRLWKDIAPLVHHHHEWWDGSGYPEGIAEQEIPLESRIIAVADAFDTMTSNSSYRDARSTDEALAELEACQGTQFDPRVVTAFRELAQAGQLEARGA
jgi:HD-GYP domain-containing protein (c-di-GMP phosphodiesterase class II)